MQHICYTKDECLMLPNGDGLVLQSDHEALMKLYQRLEFKLSLFFCREPALVNIFPLKPSFGLQVGNESCHDSWGIKQITILWWFTDSGFAILCMCCNPKQWQLSEDLCLAFVIPHSCFFFPKFLNLLKSFTICTPWKSCRIWQPSSVSLCFQKRQLASLCAYVTFCEGFWFSWVNMAC